MELDQRNGDKPQNGQSNEKKLPHSPPTQQRYQCRTEIIDEERRYTELNPPASPLSVSGTVS